MLLCDDLWFTKYAWKLLSKRTLIVYTFVEKGKILKSKTKGCFLWNASSLPWEKFQSWLSFALAPKLCQCPNVNQT